MWCVVCVVCVVCGVRFFVFVGVVVSSGPLLRRTPSFLTAQNFAVFSLSRHNFHYYIPLLGVFSLNFGGVFEGRHPDMCTFGVLRPPGLHTTDSPRARTCTFDGPGASKTPKIQQKDPKREKKKCKLWRERAIQERKFGRSGGGGVRRRGPREGVRESTQILVTPTKTKTHTTQHTTHNTQHTIHNTQYTTHNTTQHNTHAQHKLAKKRIG